MTGTRLITLGKVCALALMLVAANIAHAQFSGADEDPFLSKQYDRLVGATIEEILPPPENPGDDYAKYKAKIEKKLRGEANEELLVSLMALGVTYTPATSNELANIISEGNTYLNGEMGAAQASGILAQGLDALYNEIRDLNADEASIQLEVLRNYRKSIVYLRQAIQAKYERYENNYAMNSTETNQVINNEAGYFGKCKNGSGPSQGVNNFLGRLATLENNNTSQINNLTVAIESDLNALSLPLSTSYSELDTMIADPATPPDDVPKLEKIKSDKQKKDELIAENIWINSCETEFSPYPNSLTVIKAEEDNYMVGAFDSMNDISGEIPLPTLGTSYQSFDISGVCSSPPPSFGLTAYLNRMKSDCGTWINYYKSPYMIPPVSNSSTAAKADERYKILSNCTARGRTCNDDEFNRLAGELKAVSVFPIGRKFVVDMMISAVDYARMFYADLLGNPMFTDCEDSQGTDIQKLYCYSAQRTSTECLTGLGIDCERAEVGYLFYKFKLDTERETAQFATNQQGQSDQEFDQAEGFANLGNVEAPPTVESVGANGFGNPNAPSTAGTSSATGSALIDNTKSKQAKIQGAKVINSGKFTAPDPKSLAYQGKKRNFGGSQIVRKYIKDTYIKKSKLKVIKANKNKAGFADKVMGDLSKLALGKLAGSYTAKENLFASYEPKGSRGKELKPGESKHSKRLTSLASLGSGGSGSSGKNLVGGGALRSKGKDKDSKKDSDKDKEEKLSDAEKKKIAQADKKKNEPVFNLISSRYKKSLDKLGLEVNPLAGVIHSHKSDLFEIVSRRYKKTKIYHDHSHQP
jgi:hypothetical protein